MVYDTKTNNKVHVIEKDNIWILDNMFSEDECKKFIEESKQLGYSDAPITTGPRTSRMMKDVRNNTRAMTDNKNYASILYERIKDYLPKKASDLSYKVVSELQSQGYELSGLNERIRFYKYEANEYFAPHYDGCFRRNQDNIKIEGRRFDCYEQSFITVLLYLNDVKSGGETNFLNPATADIRYGVKPKTGQVLLFVHNNYHEGAILTDPKEQKYVMRTDVMYRKLVER